MTLNLPVKDNSFSYSNSLSWASNCLFGINAQLFKVSSNLPPQDGSSGWGSRSHLWVTGEAVLQWVCSGPWAVWLLLFHPAVSVQWLLSLLNLLVHVSDSLAFVHMLACPAADHNSAIARGFKVSPFNSLHFPTLGLFICWLLEKEEVGTLGCPEHLAQALGSQQSLLRLAGQLPLPIMS